MCYLPCPSEFFNEKPNIMKSRLIFNTPGGPMCYVDYDTVQQGKCIFEQLRQTAMYQGNNRSYQFSLFEKVRNRLVKKEWFYLPTFNVPCLSIFLDSANLEQATV